MLSDDCPGKVPIHKEDQNSIYFLPELLCVRGNDTGLICGGGLSVL